MKARSSKVDDKLRAAGRPWLLAKPVGAKVFIGPFFTPGRLFDVPVRLGRVASPTPYDELNPIAIFL
jgi:hypothetical protein